MIDVIFTKKNFKAPWFKTQEELLEDSIENFNRLLPEKFNTVQVKKTKNKSFFECFRGAVDSCTGDIVIVSDVGVLINNPLESIIKKFSDDGKLGIVGCRLVDTNHLLVDAGIERPENPQPIWRRFGEGPDAADLLCDDNNIYIDAKFIIMRKEMLQQVPITPEAKLFWAIFLCWEASRKNWSVCYSPEEVLYTNYYEKNVSVIDDMYTESQQWFADKTKAIREKKV